MKRISIDQIVDPVTLQPFTANSLKFLQDARDEDVAGMIKAFVTAITGSYSLTVPYVISGCVVSDSNKDVTAGELFYGGKYYEVVAVNGTTNVAQFVLTKTQDATADPLEFSDSTNKNVHDIYKYVGTDTATPGDFDATDLNYTLQTGKIYSNVFSAASFTVNNGAGYSDFTSLTYTTPNDGITRKWILQYKGFATPSNGFVDSACTVRIEDVTNTVTLDEVNVGKAAMGAATEVVVIPTSLNTGVISIAPNTTIKVQGGISSNPISFEQNRFSIIEF